MVTQFEASLEVASGSCPGGEGGWGHAEMQQPYCSAGFQVGLACIYCLVHALQVHTIPLVLLNREVDPKRLHCCLHKSGHQPVPLNPSKVPLWSCLTGWQSHQQGVHKM